MGRASKLAFSYGIESDLVIATKFFSKLTLTKRQSRIHLHVSKINPPENYIPLKAVMDAFSGMPKKSAAHRDG